MFVLAGYLSTGLEAEAWMGAADGIEGLDPMVAGVLMREPQEIQRIVIGILSLLKGISKSIP